MQGDDGEEDLLKEVNRLFTEVSNSLNAEYPSNICETYMAKRLFQENHKTLMRFCPSFERFQESKYYEFCYLEMQPLQFAPIHYATPHFRHCCS